MEEEHGLSYRDFHFYHSVMCKVDCPSMLLEGIIMAIITLHNLSAERPAAAKRLARLINDHEQRPWGLCETLLNCCGFRATSNDSGDTLFANPTGDVLRLKYIYNSCYMICPENCTDIVVAE